MNSLAETTRADLLDALSKAKDSAVPMVDEICEIPDKFVSADTKTSAKDILNTVFGSTDYIKHTLSGGATVIFIYCDALSSILVIAYPAER